MPDYKEMYLHLMRETEKAIGILVKAQRDCEELYLRTTVRSCGSSRPRSAPGPTTDLPLIFLPFRDNLWKIHQTRWLP